MNRDKTKGASLLSTLYILFLIHQWQQNTKLNESLMIAWQIKKNHFQTLRAARSNWIQYGRISDSVHLVSQRCLPLAPDVSARFEVGGLSCVYGRSLMTFKTSSQAFWRQKKKSLIKSSRDMSINCFAAAKSWLVSNVFEKTLLNTSADSKNSTPFVGYF